MRDYGKVSPQFWIGSTGKSLRGDPEAQVLALYLMTCPHSTMTGVFHCPILYMAHETGLGEEGASKALRRLIEGAFCEYDEASETVFVVNMARFQIGDSLKPGDKRVTGLRNELDRMPETRMKARFRQIYGEAYHIPEGPKTQSPFEAPSKPHRSQEQEQEQEQEKETPLSGFPDPDPPPLDLEPPAEPGDTPAGLLAYLNAKAGKRYRPVDANLRLVKARLKSASPDQIRRVIDAKCAEWSADPKMADYLRPETLFGPTKFEAYLGKVEAGALNGTGCQRKDWT